MSSCDGFVFFKKGVNGKEQDISQRSIEDNTRNPPTPVALPDMSQDDIDELLNAPSPATLNIIQSGLDDDLIEETDNLATPRLPNLPFGQDLATLGKPSTGPLARKGFATLRKTKNENHVSVSTGLPLSTSSIQSETQLSTNNLPHGRQHRWVLVNSYHIVKFMFSELSMSQLMFSSHSFVSLTRVSKYHQVDHR